LIYTYLMFFGIIADFGLFTIAIRELSQAETTADMRFILGNIFGMRLFSIITAMAMASLFVFLIPFENYSWSVKSGVAIASITTVFTMLESTSSAALQVRLKMWLPSLSIVIGKLIMAGYIIYTVMNFQNIPNAFYHLLFAGILGSLISFFITFSYTRRLLPFKPRYNSSFWIRIFRESLPYGMAIVLGTIYLKVDIILLSFLRPKQEIAIYGFPASMIEILLVFPIYFMNSTLPTLSRAFTISREKVSQVITHAFDFLSVMAIPMVIGGVILARPIINLIMNDQFLTGTVQGYWGADTAFQLLIIPCLFAFMNTLFSFILIASGHQAKLLKINAIGVIFNILTNLIFIPDFGFRAAAITTLLSEMIIISLTYRECKKHTHIPIHFKKLIKITTAGVIMGAFISLSQNTIPILPLVGGGALIYFCALIPLRVFTPETLSYLKKP